MIPLWSENILYDFNSFTFVIICFVTRIWSFLENVSYALEKNVYAALAGWECVINFNLVKLTDSAVEVFSILADLLPTFSTDY